MMLVAKHVILEDYVNLLWIRLVKLKWESTSAKCEHWLSHNVACADITSLKHALVVLVNHLTVTCNKISFVRARIHFCERLLTINQVKRINTKQDVLDKNHTQIVMVWRKIIVIFLLYLIKVLKLFWSASRKYSLANWCIEEFGVESTKIIIWDTNSRTFWGILQLLCVPVH